MEEGIKYDELSEVEKSEFEEMFGEDENIDKDIDSSAINKWLFNHNTIDLVLNNLMSKGLKIRGRRKAWKDYNICKKYNTRKINSRKI